MLKPFNPFTSECNSHLTVFTANSHVEDDPHEPPPSFIPPPPPGQSHIWDTSSPPSVSGWTSTILDFRPQTMFTRQPFSSDISLRAGSSTIVLLFSRFKCGKCDKLQSFHYIATSYWSATINMMDCENPEGHWPVFQSKTTSANVSM